jgi:hypothetical protein
VVQAISLFLFGPNSAATAAELLPFRIGEAAPANTFLAIWMAENGSTRLKDYGSKSST